MNKRLTLTIDGGNAAFEADSESGYGSKWSDGSGTEFARILREVADAVEADGGYPDTHTLRDSNGNVCGEVSVEVVE